MATQGDAAEGALAVAIARRSKIERVDAREISRGEFISRFAALGVPVVLRGCLHPRVADFWRREAILELAGGVRVQTGEIPYPSVHSKTVAPRQF